MRCNFVLAGLLASLLAACAHAERTAAPHSCVLTNTSEPLELVVLGSGGPGSFGRAASGYLILVDGVARILVDVGSGVFLRLGQLGVDLQRLDTVLLTHLHIDHAGDLPDFIKARDLSSSKRSLEFHIRGPEAREPYPSTTTFVERLFGPAGAFAYLPGFRNQLRLDVSDLPIAPGTPPQQVAGPFHPDDLRITAIAVDHGDVPALAYRIEHASRAIVISGDLASKTDDLIRLAQGASLLVYDAAVLDPPGAPEPLYDLHTAPERIGEVASAAHVRALVLSHLSPAVDSHQDQVLRSVRANYSGELRLAHDCLQLPVAP